MNLEMAVVLDGSGRMPTRGHDDDAGLDLYVSERIIVPSGSFRDIPCGVRVELPENTWGLLTGRSSTLRKRSLMVAQGVIDGGYRGPLFAGVWNLGREPQVVEEGDRIAQLIVIDNVTSRVNLIRTGALSGSTRGEMGFGSTGV